MLVSPFRRTVLAICLVASPALLTVGDLLHPDAVADPATQLEIIARHRDAYVVAHVLIYVGVVLLIPAALGIATVLEQRRPGSAWTTAGVALTIIGAVALAGVSVLEQVRALMVDVNGDRAVLAALDAKTLEAVPLLATVHVPTVGLTVGLLILAVALWRTRCVSGLLCGGLVVGTLLVSTPPTWSHVSTVGFAVWLLAFAGVARRVVAPPVQPVGRTRLAPRVDPPPAGARLPDHRGTHSVRGARVTRTG
jgi:hypothetical protein